MWELSLFPAASETVSIQNANEMNLNAIYRHHSMWSKFLWCIWIYTQFIIIMFYFYVGLLIFSVLWFILNKPCWFIDHSMCRHFWLVHSWIRLHARWTNATQFNFWLGRSYVNKLLIVENQYANLQIEYGIICISIIQKPGSRPVFLYIRRVRLN